MSLREMKIILPMVDNQGASLSHIHNQLKRELCQTYGGYTSVASSGGWLNDDGDLIEDNSITYIVAAMALNEYETTGFIDTVRHYATLAKQDCIYAQLASGSVLFVANASTTMFSKLAPALAVAA